MNREPNVDQVLDRWFTDGPTELPDRTVAEIVDRLDHVPQRRSMWRVGRIHLGRLSMGAAVVAVLAVSAVVVWSFPRSIEGPAAPMPTSPADWSRVMVESATGASSITRIAAGPRGVVAVARPNGGGPSRLLFSTNGREWSAADVAPRGEYVSVVATDRGFLMISSGEGAWTSENGLEWQHVADNWSGDPDAGGSIVVDVVAGGPGYVAVGNQNKVWFSTDGSDWAPAEVPPPPADLILPDYPDLSVDVMHVVAVGGNLVATGFYLAENSDATGASRDFVLASSDGRTWSTVLPDAGDIREIGAGPDGFLAIVGPLDGDRASTIWRSADGRAWQNVASQDFGSSSAIDGIAATRSGYVAVGRRMNCDLCPRPALLWTSPDGRSWSAFPPGEPFRLGEPGTTLWSVAAFGSRFVVGGQYDGRAAVWISGSGSPEATAGPVVTASPEAAAPSSRAAHFSVR